MGKGNTHALLVRMQSGTVPLDASVVISQKISKQPSSRPSYTTFEYITKRCSIVHKDMCSTMFIAALLSLPEPGNNLMSLNQRMDKENVEHLYNGVLHSRKNNNILNFAGKWMELENIIFCISHLDTTLWLMHSTLPSILAM